MSIYQEISSNQRRTFVLVFFFFTLVIFLGLVLGAVWGNSYFGLGLAVVVGLLYFLFSWYGGSKAILMMVRAREAKKPEHTYLINIVEGLALAAGLPMPKVYVIDDSALNAFATGRNPQQAAVTVTTGLLQKLNKLELEGVIAHEISHIKNYDIRVMMLAAVMVGMAVLLSDFILRSFWIGGHGQRKEGNQLGVLLLVVGIILAILAPLIGELIKLALSRRREYLADADGALLTRYPKGLAEALKKIKGDPDPLVDYANRATAHLFISSPFRKGAWNSVFSTHPPIDERIKKLEGM